LSSLKTSTKLLVRKKHLNKLKNARLQKLMLSYLKMIG
jgi:hypothetical protein